MGLPNAVMIKAGDQTLQIAAFNAANPIINLKGQAIQIFASGPSMAEVDFSPTLLATPSLFVNGSLSLTGEHDFTQVAGYVISDARFVNHQPQILERYYQGQPLYATLAVFEALAATHADILLAHHQAMRVIYPVDRPWGVKVNKPWHGRLPFSTKWLNRKKPLSHFASHPSFEIDVNHLPDPIGVSLDITHGFVEAGTVAYVATQLAFTLEAAAIHLYGIDLINSDQPRFYENADNSAPSKLDKAVAERIVPSFDLLGRIYQEHGVAVINHSPVSKDLFKHLSSSASTSAC
ncbi:MAG: hypothetical protein Q4P13_09210 [Psychrobacter sp.]|nr:hypothetical protein [Psychrobacter sp.]